MTEKAQEGNDPIRIHIYIMSALTVITFFWLVFNWFSCRKLEKKIKEGIIDLEQIIVLENDLPPRLEEDEASAYDFPNKEVFFKRIAGGFANGTGNEKYPDIIADIDKSPETLLIGGINFEDQSYQIEFITILDRRELARYILLVQKNKKFLKVKRLFLRRAQSAQPHEDKWKVEIEFFSRRVKPQ